MGCKHNGIAHWCLAVWAHQAKLCQDELTAVTHRWKLEVDVIADRFEFTAICDQASGAKSCYIRQNIGCGFAGSSIFGRPNLIEPIEPGASKINIAFSRQAHAATLASGEKAVRNMQKPIIHFRIE